MASWQPPTADAVVANTGQPRREGAAAAGGVMWVQHSDEQLAKGSDEGRIVAELAPADNRDLPDVSGRLRRRWKFA